VYGCGTISTFRNSRDVGQKLIKARISEVNIWRPLNYTNRSYGSTYKLIIHQLLASVDFHYFRFVELVLKRNSHGDYFVMLEIMYL